jgi:NADH-quinone oxidoreductase subunit N
MTSDNPLPLLPEVLVLLGAVTVLLSGSFLPRQRQWVARLIAAAALTGAGVTAAVASVQPAQAVFADTFTVDTSTAVARLVIAGSALLVLGLGAGELGGDRRESEHYTLILLSSLGAMVLAAATDLLLLAVGYLLASLPLYALIGLRRTAASAEAAMKTYLLGALLGIAMLLGVTLLSALAGATSYTALATQLAAAPSAAVTVGLLGLLGGLMFKAGAVPGHFWVPDAAQGAGTTAAAFLTTVPKIGALVGTARLLDVMPVTVDWRLLIAVLAAASMTVGNFAAFTQTDPRRLLGWSTVSQAGYLLVPVVVIGDTDLALRSLLFYLAAYAVTNLAAFAVVAAVPQHKDLASYRGLGSTRPWLAGALVVSLLGLVGTPPTAVFVGKLVTFSAAWDGGYAWLAGVAAVNTVASLFYYLRWIAPVYATDGAGDRGAGVPRAAAPGTAVLAAAVSLALGIGAGVVLPLLGAPLLR